MAIEKIKGTPKVEWTVSTLINLGVTVILVVLSGVLGWMAFANWRFKSSLVDGYQEYDRGRATAAKSSLEAALSWRPKNVGARELLAKILCDEGNLDGARKQYNILKAQGQTTPQIVPTSPVQIPSHAELQQYASAAQTAFAHGSQSPASMSPCWQIAWAQPHWVVHSVFA